MAHHFLPAVIKEAGTQVQCRIAKVRSTGLKLRAKGKEKSKSKPEGQNLLEEFILISN